MASKVSTPDRRRWVEFWVAVWLFALVFAVLAAFLAVKLGLAPDLGREPRPLLAVLWALLLVHLLFPVVLYLTRGWAHRKEDILASVSPTAQALYLRNFQATDQAGRAYYDRLLAVLKEADEYEDHVSAIRLLEETEAQLGRKKAAQKAEKDAGRLRELDEAIQHLSDERDRLAGQIPAEALTFVRHVLPGPSAEAEARFERFYTDRFGRWRFFWPTALLLLLAAVLLSFPVAAGEAGWRWLVSGDPGEAARAAAPPPGLPLLAGSAAAPAPPGTPAGEWTWVIAFAILGGYTRVVYELVTRYYQDNIRPADLFWWCYRLLISVPLGYAVAVLLAGNNPRAAFAVAFLLGLFPTWTVTNFGRRLFAKATQTAEADTDLPAQLREVPSLDPNTTLLLTEEGISTYTELAYTDPIRLCIRTGKDFSTVVTWTSEALLLGYLSTRDRMEAARRFGVAGAYEAANLWDAATDDTDTPEARAERDRAFRIIRELAAKLDTPEDGVWNTLAEIAGDPYAQFVAECWGSNFADD